MTNLAFVLGTFVLLTAPSVRARPLAATPVTSVAPPSARPAAAAVPRAAFLARIDNNYRVLDANHDGVLTGGEIAVGEARARAATDSALLARRREAFARLDTNRDGQLSQSEFDAAAAAVARPAPADPAALVARLDSNHDKSLSLAEFRAPALARFDRADLNHDGQVTPDEERTAARPR